jgi:hypothetical protein
MTAPAFPDQPPPVGESDVVLPVVVAALTARAEQGRVKYGTYLRVRNGRDPLIDAWQEAADLLMYLTQAIMERDGSLP